VARLEKLADRLADGPGILAVLDANVLLHFDPPAQVNWLEVQRRIGALSAATPGGRRARPEEVHGQG
jgi:hypothetical protein